MENLVEKYKIYRYAAKIAGERKAKELNTVMENMALDFDFNERFIQTIWNEQKLEGELTTEEGSIIKVLSNGIWNNGAGPDFHNASMLIDGKFCSGDVEIHKKRSDWYKHGHEGDERYGNVILHVVWENDMQQVPGKMPIVVISKYVNEDWRRLLWELEESRYSYADKIGKGECVLRWAMTEDGKVRRLLEAAGIARYGSKVSNMRREIEKKGEERALLEGIFDVLGYKNNRKQFHQIAEALEIGVLQSSEIGNLEKEALIFGTANMIPDTTRCRINEQMAEYVDLLWDAWWRIGQRRKLVIEWDNTESRPYNRPWRRLVAGIELLKITDWMPNTWVRSLAASCASSQELFKGINALNNKNTIFRDYTSFESIIKPGADLLGRERIADLACNVLLPFITAIGEIERNEKYMDLGRKTYMSMSSRQGNRLTKEASARFLTPPSRIKDLVKSTCQQQGLLDIYKNFCLALDNNCTLCPFSGNNG
ncbi:MAG: DUF2851 family protein [Victivallales bacterium]|nr:DUF2851 family protein [Victivallales bacterium]